MHNCLAAEMDAHASRETMSRSQRSPSGAPYYVLSCGQFRILATIAPIIVPGSIWSTPATPAPSSFSTNPGCRLRVVDVAFAQPARSCSMRAAFTVSYCWQVGKLPPFSPSAILLLEPCSIVIEAACGRLFRLLGDL